MSPSEIPILILVFLTFLWSLLCILINASSGQSQKLPPGPRALPIIGSLHMLGNLPHRSLQNLAKKYGPIMSMRLGGKTTIVVSSPKAAELFLKTHDTIFASRPKLQASKYMSYGTKSMAFSEYGPYWRHVRKLCTLQLLSPSRIQAFAPLRKEEVGLLVQSLKVAAQAGEVVDLSEKVGELVVGITYRMVLGRKNNDMFDLKGIIEEVIFLSGAFNVGDYVPFLIPLDLQALEPPIRAPSSRATILSLAFHSGAPSAYTPTWTGASSSGYWVGKIKGPSGYWSQWSCSNEYRGLNQKEA